MCASPARTSWVGGSRSCSSEPSDSRRIDDSKLVFEPDSLDRRDDATTRLLIVDKKVDPRNIFYSALCNPSLVRVLGILRYWKGAGGFDQNGEPFLLLALEWKDRPAALEALRAMLDGGATLAGSVGRRALCRVIEQGWFDAARFFVQRGADTGSADTPPNEDALGFAKNQPAPAFAKLIRDARAQRPR